MRPFLKYLPSLATAALVLLGSSIEAKANVINIAVQNGSFETLALPGQSNELNSLNSTNTGTQQATGWTSALAGTGVPGYNFVFSSDAVVDQYGGYGPAYGTQYGSQYLWAKNPDGTPNSIGPSPDGGNFIGMDGAFESTTISTVLSGLTIGMDTKVYYWFAGAQEETDNGTQFNGVTTESFQVSLSDAISTQTQNGPTLDNSSHGFTGWYYTYVDFVPTSTSETLSFLAKGTPNGLPPFSLLDGISVVQVTPEPSTLALLGTGILAVAALLRRRRVATTA